MREAAGGADPWRMVRRRARADPAFGKGLYVVELPRRRLDSGRPRPAARPHLGLTRAEGWRQRFQDYARRPRLGTPVRPRAGNGDAGSVAIRYSAWRQPSKYRWRAGWCGLRVRRAGGALRRDRFRARADTNCASAA